MSESKARRVYRMACLPELAEAVDAWEAANRPAMEAHRVFVDPRRRPFFVRLLKSYCGTL